MYSLWRSCPGICHITWKCPEVNKHRQHKDLCDIDPDLLPKYIQNGVPKAMSTNLEATYWGDVHDDNSMQSNQQTCKAMGMQVCKKNKLIASSKNQQVKEVLNKHDLQQGKCNARQCFKLLGPISKSHTSLFPTDAIGQPLRKSMYTLTAVGFILSCST